MSEAWAVLDNIYCNPLLFIKSLMWEFITLPRIEKNHPGEQLEHYVLIQDIMVEAIKQELVKYWEIQMT
jgi:hypothetical protein